MLEISFNVFVDDIIKSFIKEGNEIDKQMDGSRFNVKFVGSLSIRCDRVNEPKGSRKSSWKCDKY